MRLKHNLLIFKLLLLIAAFPNLAAFGQQNNISPFPERIILNLTQNSGNSVAVTWRTDSIVTEGFCELQMLTAGRINPADSKSYKAQTSAVQYIYESEPVIKVNQHSCVINDLVPGKKYLYRVGGTDKWSEWFEFQTPSSDNGRFTFVYFGDPQTEIKSQWSRIVRKAYKMVPDCAFMLYGGDIINRGGRDQEWNEWFNAGSYIFASVPQVLTPGNHDYEDLQIDPHWKYQFTQPQNGPVNVKGTCFFSDYKNLKIISIDSAVESELEDENGKALNNQKIWLDSLLSVNTKEWVILTTHLPFYSTKDTRDNPQLRKNFQPILEKYGVDLVLTGHDHSYGRGIVSDNPDVKATVVYVVSVSGPKLYESGNKSWMQFKGGNVQLFQTITIDDNKLEFKALTADGELFDHFSLEKAGNGKKRFIEQNRNAVKLRNK